MSLENLKKLSSPGEIIKIIFLTVAAGFSVGIFIWEFNHFYLLKDFIFDNFSTRNIQNQILLHAGISIGILSLLIGGIFLVSSVRKIDSETIRKKTTFLLLILLSLFAVPILFEKNLWRAEPLFSFLILIIFTFYNYFIFLNNREELDFLKPMEKVQNFFTDRFCFQIILVLIVFYSIYFSFYSILNHYQFGTAAYDLGINETALFNTSRGDFMYTSYVGGPLWKFHFSPVYFYALFPFYYFFPYTETILIIQSVVIALAALPLYLLSKRILGSNIISLIIAFCFLIYPAQHGANFNNMHDLAFVPLFLFLMFYFLITRKYLGYYIAIILLLSVKEDMPILVAFTACFVFLYNRKVFHLFITLLLSFCWYLLAKKIMALSGAQFGGYTFYYAPFFAQGTSGLLGLFKSILTNPFFVFKNILTVPKCTYFLQIVLPLAFVPFLINFRKNIFLLFYGLAVILLGTAANSAMYTFGYQYIWYIAPGLFVATLFSLSYVRVLSDKNINVRPPLLLEKSQKIFLEKSEGMRAKYFDYKLLVSAILFLSIVISWQYGAIFNQANFRSGKERFHFSEKEKKELAALKELVALIPPGSSVSASESLCPHITTVKEISTFRYFDGKGDYLLLYFPNQENRLKYKELLSQNKYEIFKKESRFQLLKKVE